jgi:hypothetical protein
MATYSLNELQNAVALAIVDTVKNNPPAPIKIGSFTIFPMSRSGDPSMIYIWMDHPNGCEGGDFPKEKLNEMLIEFWKKEF